MKKLQIYDPPMCCSTGVCGPSVDPKIVQFAAEREEQTRIASRLDTFVTKLDELQRMQREVDAELSSFTPALLAKAFRREL